MSLRQLHRNVLRNIGRLRGAKASEYLSLEWDAYQKRFVGAERRDLNKQMGSKGGKRYVENSAD